MKKLTIFMAVAAFFVVFSLGTAMAVTNRVVDVPVIDTGVYTPFDIVPNQTIRAGYNDRALLLLGDQTLAVNSEVFYLAPSINWQQYNKLDISSHGLGVPTPQQVMGYAYLIRAQMRHRPQHRV